MTTYSCDASADEDKREEAPQQLAQTFMVGKWTFHAYRKSHDGKTLIHHKKDGIQVQQGDKVFEYKMALRQHNPREFLFSPDNSQVAFWAPQEQDKPAKRIALMNLGSLGAKSNHNILYAPKHGRHPFGMEWAPDGKAMFVVERQHKDDVDYAILSRLEVPGGRVTELFRTAGNIDFFMPPVSRFENGQGPSKDPYMIIFGCENGLYLIDPKTGKDRTRLSRLPAVGLHNLEWNPDPKKNQIMLFFKNPVTSEDGGKFEGVYLVDVDKMREAPADASGLVAQESFMEQLHRKRDIHTLWFSPKGTYATWSSNESIYFREPIRQPTEQGEEEKTKTAVIEIMTKDDNPRQIKGVTWNDDETKLAFTADNQIWVYDLDPKEALLKKADEKAKKAHEAALKAAKKAGLPAPPEPEPDPVDASIEAVTGKRPFRYMIREFSEGFTADPEWVGDRVVLTLFEDAREEIKRLRNRPSTKRPKHRRMGDGPNAKPRESTPTDK